MFTALDWCVLALFLAFCAALGLWLSRGKKNFADYMFGGGKIPWAAVGISLIATSVSSTTFLGAPADVFGADMTFLMFQFGALISVAIVGAIFIPRFRSSGIQSAYELFERKFSRTTRRLAAAFYCMHLLLRTGILLYAPALVLSQILGIGLGTAILVTAVIAVLYTWLGGIKAVIWTDVLQFFVFFGGGLFVLFLVARACGGFGEMAALASEAGKTKWLDLSLDPSNARTLVSAGLAYAVLEVAIRGCDQQFVQRYLSCKSPAAANASSVLSMVLGFVISLLFYWVGAALFVYYKVVKASPLPEALSINDVFPYFIVNALPQGVTGLVVAAICAAAMSSLSSAINSLSNTTENDLFCFDTKAAASLSRAKLWTLVWGILGIAAAMFAATRQGSLLKNALFFTGLFTGPLLGMFLLAFFTKKMRPYAVIVGVLCGMFSVTLFNGIAPLGIPAAFAGILSWPWMPLVSSCVTVVCAVLLDLPSKFAPRKPS